MERLQRSLIRIVKGPTGGFLASLGIAAVLGGVALASPAPPLAGRSDHHPDVIAAAPLEGNATPSPAHASGAPTATGGVHGAADPTGRGLKGRPTGNGHHAPSWANGSGSSEGRNSSGGVRSAGAAPAHQDARDDPSSTGEATHDRGRHNHRASGHNGSGTSGSGGQSGDKGSDGSGASGTGSGGSGSGQRGDGGGSGGGNGSKGGSKA